MQRVVPVNTVNEFCFHTKWTLCICYLVKTAVLAFSKLEKHKIVDSTKVCGHSNYAVQHIYCLPLEGSGKPQNCPFTTLKTYALSDFFIWFNVKAHFLISIYLRIFASPCNCYLCVSLSLCVCVLQDWSGSLPPKISFALMLT